MAREAAHRREAGIKERWRKLRHRGPQGGLGVARVAGGTGERRGEEGGRLGHRSPLSWQE